MPRLLSRIVEGRDSEGSGQIASARSKTGAKCGRRYYIINGLEGIIRHINFTSERIIGKS